MKTVFSSLPHGMGGSTRQLLTLVVMLTARYAWAVEPDCPKAMTTADMTNCLVSLGEKADEELARYTSTVDASLRTPFQDEEADKGRRASLDAFLKSQESWRGYRREYCDAVSSQFWPGSMSGVAVSSCYLRLTRRRTHDIWQDFLVGSNARLPEPTE